MRRVLMWEKAKTDLLRQLFKDGKNPNEIAVCLKRSISSIYSRCRHLGLSFQARHRGDVIKEQTVSDVDEIPCLCCRINFKSENIKKNRICPSCTRINSGYVGVVYG